ncbi:putative membrane protein YfaA [Escherichia coli]|uniref:Putative membrane protein YfaA n=1 Tax=Escherichia coli TaxID=562 RepID=A0A376NSC6_ECOLX|nr:putative membrane protein YfaA [Escherichia coli]
MSGEKKAKGWRFYGLVGFGAIALLSAGVWALQYAGSGPEKTLSPLVVHNNLQIDLNEPDLFLDSDSLSQLPKDLLTIPFLHDVLSEDFVSIIRIMPIVWALKAAFVVLSMNTISR